jgi:hypothetical protein
MPRTSVWQWVGTTGWTQISFLSASIPADHDISISLRFQGMTPTCRLAEWLEDAFRAIHLDLAYQLKQFAQFPFRKSLLFEPQKVIHGQIIKRHAVRRKCVRAVFPERHVLPTYLRESFGQFCLDGG